MEAMAVDFDRIPCSQLPPPPQLNAAVHPHIAPLDALLGLATALGQPLVLEELIELHGRDLRV